MSEADLVQVLRWPAESAQRQPDRWPACLWLLPFGELPPDLGQYEAWIRIPATEHDIAARADELARLVVAPPLEPGEVVVGIDGEVTRLGATAWLPPIEAAIMDALGATPDRVVTREALAEAAWGDPTRVGRQLDSRVFSLRGRLAPLGLAIHTIRSRGYLLTTASPNDPAPRGRSQVASGD